MKMKLRKLAAVLLSLMITALAVPAVSAASDEYDTSGATSFVFSDSGITAKDGKYTGYETDGCELKINESGTYVLSGECSDGSVTVKKEVTDVVLVLSGLDLTSADTAPITCNKSSGVTIVCASGTKNSLADTALNNDENYPDNTNAENAVIKAKAGSNITLCGSGELSITANGKNGIKTGASTDEEGEASLTIKSLTLNISAGVNDGINAGATLNIPSGNITVSAADDGIHCDYTMTVGETGAAGPTINITECYEGLEAATLVILSGDITINGSDDCLNAANSDLSDYDFSITISGGTLKMYTSAGDGIDSNGSLTITGGTTEVWTANTADNQPLDADGTITITGGTVLAAGGSAGMGMNLDASQAYVIYGSSQMGGGMGGFPGGNAGSAPEMPSGDVSGNPPEMPSGDASGERPEMPSGDASGNAPEMPSGDASGNAPEMPSGDASGNAPEMPSGGMDSFPGGTSSVSISSGSTVEIKSADGNTVYSSTAPCNAGFVFFTSSELSGGDTYTLYSNGESAGEATADGTTSSNTNGTTAADTGAVTEAPTETTDDTAADDNDRGIVLIVVLAVVFVGGGAAAAIAYKKKSSGKDK